MDGVKNYLSELTDVIGRSWNRFWFTPSSPIPLAILRILVGLGCLYFLISHSADLIRWFGPHGLLPVEVVEVVEEASQQSRMPLTRWSYLNLTTSPAGLWALHVAGLVIVTAFTLGVATRISSILSLFVILAYIHRAPFLAGQFEPVLTMLLLYLCIGPCGEFLSVDQIWTARKSREKAGRREPAAADSDRRLSAGIAIRLMQVHLSIIYLFMGLAKLGGAAWWNGTAIWWLVAQTQSRLLDLSDLSGAVLFVNFWTHLVVLFELTFALLIWNRWARPLLLAVSIPMWITLALVTGLVSFSCIMLVANLVFVPAESLRYVANSFLYKLGMRPEKLDAAVVAST